MESEIGAEPGFFFFFPFPTGRVFVPFQCGRAKKEMIKEERFCPRRTPSFFLPFFFPSSYRPGEVMRKKVKVKCPFFPPTGFFPPPPFPSFFLYVTGGFRYEEGEYEEMARGVSLPFSFFMMLFSLSSSFSLRQ